MKLYLASFLEPDNWGNGRIISITEGNKPFKINVSSKFPPFTPPTSLIKSYNDLRIVDSEKATEKFVSAFSEQLSEYSKQVFEEGLSSNKSARDILPFKDGDTLCSWERKKFSNYRKLIAPVLETMGYDVVCN